MTKKVLYDIENMDQPEDLISLTCNPQEAASVANLQITTIQSEIKILAESFFTQADALATWFPNLLPRLHHTCLLNQQKKMNTKHSGKVFPQTTSRFCRKQWNTEDKSLWIR